MNNNFTIDDLKIGYVVRFSDNILGIIQPISELNNIAKNLSIQIPKVEFSDLDKSIQNIQNQLDVLKTNKINIKSNIENLDFTKAEKQAENIRKLTEGMTVTSRSSTLNENNQLLKTTEKPTEVNVSIKL